MKDHTLSVVGSLLAGVFLGAMACSLPATESYFLILSSWFFVSVLVGCALLCWISVLVTALLSRKRPDRSLVALASGTSYLLLTCGVIILTVWVYGRVVPS